MKAESGGGIGVNGEESTLPPSWAEALEHPRRAPDVELVGPMQDMAYEDQKWLICFGEANYIQSTKLLYHILLHADGRTPIAEIARLVSAETDAEISADQARWLVMNRLAQSGLLVVPGAPADSSSGGETAASAPEIGPLRPAEAPVLGIRHRLPLLPYATTAPLTGLLKYLYWPPLIVAVTVAAAAVNYRFYSGPDLMHSLKALLYAPEMVLMVIGLDMVTRIWHELGHASALRRAGARYGDIGVALYVIFPVYYTDVSHSYRLNRGERIRVDLGGIYFDLIAMVALYLGYSATGYAVLLLMIGFIGLSILRQFTPFLRFDGYYLLADIVGVPEPLSLVAPFVRSLLPGGSQRGISQIRPKARLALFAYLLIVLGFMTRPFLLLAVAGVQFLTYLQASGRVVLLQFIYAWRHHSVLLQVTASLELLFWSLVPISLILFTSSMARLAYRGLRALARHIHQRFAGRVVLGQTQPAVAAGGATAQPRTAPLPAPQPVMAADGRGSMTPRPAWHARTPMATPSQPHPVRPAPVRAFKEMPKPMNSLLMHVDSGSAAGTGQPDNADAAVERVLERFGADYMANMRPVAEEIARVYSEQVSMQQKMIDDLARRARAVEEERDLLAGQLAGLEFSLVKHSDDLRRLGQEFISRAEAADRDRQATFDLIRGAS